MRTTNRLWVKPVVYTFQWAKPKLFLPSFLNPIKTHQNSELTLRMKTVHHFRRFSHKTQIKMKLFLGKEDSVLRNSKLKDKIKNKYKKLFRTSWTNDSLQILIFFRLQPVQTAIVTTSASLAYQALKSLVINNLRNHSKQIFRCMVGVKHPLSKRFPMTTMTLMGDPKHN